MGNRPGRVLEQASATLAAARHEAEVVRALTRLAVPALADACVVDTLEDAAAVRRVAHARSPRAARDLARRDPLDPDGPSLLGRVLRTGRAELEPDLLAAPLVARDRTLGVLALLVRAPRRFGSGDLVLTKLLAGQAALALDNARLTREARQAAAASDTRLAVLSHGLRDAMNATLGWAQVLRTWGAPGAPPTPPRSGRPGAAVAPLDSALAARALDTIERNTRLQARLVANLFDASRIAGGQLVLEPEPLDLRPIVEAVIEDVRGEATARGILLLTSLTPAPVRGDAARLHQVVGNLVANALEFTDAEGWAEVRLAHVGPDVELRVLDSGRGIDPSLLPHVFDGIHLEEATATAGRGLGLAIVRSIVELHGGAARVESEGVGKGTAVIVTLPRLSG